MGAHVPREALVFELKLNHLGKGSVSLEALTRTLIIINFHT